MKAIIIDHVLTKVDHVPRRIQYDDLEGALEHLAVIWKCHAECDSKGSFRVIDFRNGQEGLLCAEIHTDDSEEYERQLELAKEGCLVTHNAEFMGPGGKEI